MLNVFFFPISVMNFINTLIYSIAIYGCLKCLLSSSGSFGFCQTFDDDEWFNDLLMKNADLITAKITLDVNNCLYAA